MMRRYLTLGPIPEFRPEPIQNDAKQAELELLLPLDVYHEAQEIASKIRLAWMTSCSSQRLWHDFGKLVAPYVVNEKDRIWFKKHMV